MDRLNNIAMIILENEVPISTSCIASQLGVSVKTVRNDMEKLEDVIGKEGLHLVKKTGIGNYIEGSNDNKQLLLDTLKNETSKVQPFSSDGRQKHILHKLFIDGKRITASSLANEMYVSTSTVYKDLKLVDEIIKPYSLMIVKKNNRYLELKGDEKHYRNAIANLIFQNKDEVISSEGSYDENSRIDLSTRRQLDTLMKIDYRMLESHINRLEQQLNFQFSQEAFISLVTHIAIAIKRIKSGKDILLTDETLNSLKGRNEYIKAEQMSKKIGLNFGVVIPEQEVGYITLHILGGKMGGEGLLDPNGQLDKVKEMDLALEIANKMITIASDTLHTNLKEDQILLNGLALHLRPTINRLKYGLSLRNPILQEIKDNYPDIFGVAWILGKVLHNYFDVSIPESEIGYIALHIGASIERNRAKIKTLVVCHSGIGTSQLVSARLRRCFKELDIIGIQSSINLDDVLIEEADIIISTVPLSMKLVKPVFMISPLFNSEDVKKVEWLIAKFQQNKLEGATNIIAKEVFVRSKTFYKKELVISDICKSLVKRNYVCRGYEKSVIDRENIYSTEVGRGIAIPHGDPSEVKKSCISVTVLNHPMKWEEEIVEFVLFVSLKTEDICCAKTIFTNLSNFMEDENFIHHLRGGQDSAIEALNQLWV